VDQRKRKVLTNQLPLSIIDHFQQVHGTGEFFISHLETSSSTSTGGIRKQIMEPLDFE
jgi:hypothetical protein